MGNCSSLRTTDPTRVPMAVPNSPEVLEIAELAATSLSSIWVKNADAIKEYKQKMIAINDTSYKEFVQDYLSSSAELLKFFTELEDFLDSARRIHSYYAIQLQHGVGREEAKTTSEVNDHFGDKLIEMASCFIKMMGEMFSKYRDMEKKLAKHYNWWKKFVNFFSFITECFSCLGLAFVNLLSTLSPKGVEYMKPLVGSLVKVSNDVKRNVDEWNTSQVLKNVAADTMTNFAQHSKREMEELKDNIQKIRNSRNQLLASSRDIANGLIPAEVGIMNIKRDSERFLDKIKVLEEKTAESYSKICKAREEVLK